jgi:hypothetical protein
MLYSLIKNNFRIIPLYFLFTIIIFSFFALPGTITVAGSIKIPFIEYSKSIFHFFLSIFVFGYVFLTRFKSFKIDIIFIFLSVRVVYYFIQNFLFFNYPGFYGHFLAILIPPLTYFISLNYKGDTKIFSQIYIVFALIISIQTLITSLYIPFPLFDYNYKFEMVIPLASSNVIAIYILPGILLINKTFKGNFFKLFLLMILILGLIFTSSRGAIFVLVSFLLVKFFLNRFKKNSLYFLIFVFIFLLIFLILVSISAFLFNYSIIFDSLLEIFSFIDSFSTGRVDLFFSEIERGLLRPFFGTGLFYFDNAIAGSHNFIIDSFVQTGLLGLIIFMLPIFNVIKSIIRLKNIPLFGFDDFIFLITFFSLIEVSFMFYISDALFWFFAGIIGYRKGS